MSDGGRGPVPGGGGQLGRGLRHRGDPWGVHQREEVQRVDQGADRAARGQSVITCVMSDDINIFSATSLKVLYSEKFTVFC